MKKPYNHFIETVNCPICETDHQVPYIEVKYSQLKQKKSLDYTLLGITGDTLFKIKKCLNCGFVFVNPRIKKQFEDLIYNKFKKDICSQHRQRSDGDKRGNERRNKFRYLSPCYRLVLMSILGKMFSNFLILVVDTDRAWNWLRC